MSKWIPVTERLPTDLNDVLIFTMWRTMDVCFFDKEYKCWISTNGSYNKDCVTHWMPLPLPPQEENKDD